MKRSKVEAVRNGLQYCGTIWRLRWYFVPAETEASEKHEMYNRLREFLEKVAGRSRLELPPHINLSVHCVAKRFNKRGA